MAGMHLFGALCKNTQYAWVEVCQADHFPHYQYQTSKKAKQRGAIIHYGPSKRVTIYADLVKRVPVTEDESPADTTPKPKPDYTKTAQRYMADHKTMAVQATLLANPGKAREVAIVQMMTRATGIQTFPDKALPHHRFYSNKGPQTLIGRAYF